MVITLERSKTDQTGEGTQCIIPFGNDTRCPVRALIDWRKISSHAEGPIFRRITKGAKVLEPAINARTWNRLIRELAEAAGLPNAALISSHSLRRGFATEASRLGASMPAIQRHGDGAQLRRYWNTSKRGASLVIARSTFYLNFKGK